MPNEYLQQLTEETSPAYTDLFPITDNGTQRLRKVTVATFFESTYNVKHYGALGDNSTDDTSAIQAAIDAAEADGGGMVYFPQGIYLTTGNTIDSTGVHLVGAGLNAAIIKTHSSTTGATVTISNGYCGIRDILFNGNKASATSAGSLIHLSAGSRCTFARLYLHDGNGIGIEIGTSASPTPHASRWSDIFVIDMDDVGVFIKANGYDAQFSNLWIGQCGGSAGLRCEAGANFFSNLHIWGGTGDGVELRSDENRLSNVYIENNAVNGLDIFNAKYNTIIGGNIELSASHGANISGTSDRNIFADLEVFNNGVDGIRISAGNYTIISACNFYDYQGTKTQDRPINITASGVTGTVISGCIAQAADHATGGISDSGTGTLIANTLGQAEIAFNNAGENIDTRIEGDTDTDLVHVDASADRVGIGEAVPDYKLDVNGTFGFSPGSSVTPVDNGDVVIEATNNTTLTLKLKGSDGTVRSGTITLS